MAKGRKTGGRRKGTRNKKTVAQIDALVASGEVLPLAYLLTIMRDEGQPLDVRLFCAKAAAPYCHHRLSSVEHNGHEADRAPEYEVTLTFD
jgi:hypothetical protein